MLFKKKENGNLYYTMYLICLSFEKPVSVIYDTVILNTFGHRRTVFQCEILGLFFEPTLFFSKKSGWNVIPVTAPCRTGVK